MSNQNFDTNGPLPSSSLPVPIAKQLEAQAYLCQVQNQWKDASKKQQDSSSAKLPERFSDYSALQDVTSPPPVNKMDAFFKQVEEEERQRALEAQASKVDALEPTVEESSSDLADDLQTAAPFQQGATPTVEPSQIEPSQIEPSQIDVAADEVAVQPEVTDPFQVEEVIASTPTPQEPSPFSAESFSASPLIPSPTADAQPQSSDQQVEAPVETISSSASPTEAPFTSPQPFTSQFQSASPELAEAPESPESPESANNAEARRLTGAAGLSAGWALAGAAGAGALGAFTSGEASSDVNELVESQLDDQSVAIVKSIQSIRQQLGNAQRQVPSEGDAMIEPVKVENGDAALEPNDASEFNNDPPLEPSQAATANIPAQNDGNQDTPGQYDLAQNDQSPNPSSSPEDLPAVVAGGFSGGFNPFSPTSVASSANDSQVQQANNASGPENDVPQNIVPPTAPHPQEKPVEPTTQSPATIQEGDDNVEDIRIAAERQAQRIKAERAKALVDGTDVPARPFGAGDVERPTSVEDRQTVLENLETPQAGQAPAADTQQPPDQTAAAADPQPVQTPNARLLEDNGDDADLTLGRRFPMELFNKYLLKNLGSGVVFVDHKRRVQLWSKGAEAMTGILSDAVIERPLYPQTFNLRFEDGTGVPQSKCPLVKCLETMEDVTADYRTLNAENQEVRIEVAIIPVIDQERLLNGAIILLNDHTAEIDLQRQLKDLYEFSVLDPLTQVANRAEFERVLEEYVRAFNQSESFNCSIIICDIDFFKSINDKFGHAVGDQALVAFSEMLTKYVRSQDLVARYGGEEFVILCADCDTDAALQRAEEIRMGLFKTPQAMLDGKSISASFGVSELRPGDTAMEFFVRADTALLKAKELGRNRVVIADQREANRQVDITEDGSLSGMQWRQQRREHTALVCEEFKTSTPVPVLVEKLRGFIIDKDAWLQRVDQEFLSMEVDFEAPNDYSRKGNFTLNIEFKEADEEAGGLSNKMTFIRITIFPARRKKWFATNHTDVAPQLLSDLRSYLMINDEASHLSIKLATENVRAK